MSLHCCYLRDSSSLTFWPRFTAFYSLSISSTQLCRSRGNVHIALGNAKPRASYWKTQIIAFLQYMITESLFPSIQNRQNTWEKSHIISYLFLDYSLWKYIIFLILQILTHVIPKITRSFMVPNFYPHVRYMFQFEGEKKDRDLTHLLISFYLFTFHLHLFISFYLNQ